jgi:hypothetical protein
MSNTNAPFGAKPVGYKSGASYQGKCNLYYLAASNGDALHVGDFVKSSAVGDDNGVPGIDKCATTNVCRGIVVGLLPVYPGVSMVGAALNLENAGYLSATNADACYALVADEPDLVFEIQCGSVVTNLVSTKLSNNFEITVAVPSPATNPLSATIVDNTTIATTNTLTLKMLGLAKRPNNAIGAYQVVNACFNTHELSGALIAGV